MINYLSSKLKVRKAFLYSLILFLIIASYFGIIKKEIKFIEEHHFQIELLEEQIKSIEYKIKSQRTVNSQNYINIMDKEKDEDEIGMQSQLVLKESQLFAQEVGLDILGFKTSEQKNTTEFKSRSYDYMFEGSYESFVSWLRLMEQTTYFINLEKLHIAPKSLLDDDLTEIPYDNKLIFIVSTNNIALSEYSWIEKENINSRKYPFYPSLVVRE